MRIICPPFIRSQKGTINITEPTPDLIEKAVKRETIKEITNVEKESTTNLTSSSNNQVDKSNNSSPSVNNVQEQQLPKIAEESIEVDDEIVVLRNKTQNDSPDGRTSRLYSKADNTDPKISRKSRFSEIGKKKNRPISEYIQSGPVASNENKRKTGVNSENVNSSQPIKDIQYQKYEKDASTKELLIQALNANDFIRNLMDDERIDRVVEAMRPEDYDPDTFIIREGEVGSHLFVSGKGIFEVIKGGKTVKKFGAGEAFGELAVLYKAKRFASIKVKTKSQVWVLDRIVFQKIMLRTGKQEQEENIKFLSTVPLLEGISHELLSKISDFLKREFYLAGTTIIRQGEKGDKFYIIRGGTVAITRRPPGGGPEELIKTLSRGDYFGEQALLHEDKRLATIKAKDRGVECLVLDRVPFNELLGDIEKLKERPPDIKPAAAPVVYTSEYDHIKFEELTIIGTLGVGGFGRVELVQYTMDKGKTFALKKLVKADVVKEKRQQHAFNEKNIMIRCSSPFICKLYKTYKDNHYVYFLMEPLLGGDLWTALQIKKYFKDKSSRFMIACVVEAFEYLHDRNIVYRDLKPENLMFDYKGYVKLVDFGYAKFIASNSKTYTFAGTPEYVAPEIILSKGHDKACDYWTLGILVHELLVGKPPFRGGNHMKTYGLILKGIDSVEFNQRITKKAKSLIRKLCRQDPTQRLGYLKNGIKDIKNHIWFDDFDWRKLQEKSMPAPLLRPIKSNTDLNNFDKYTKETPVAEDFSGWDEEF